MANEFISSSTIKNEPVDKELLRMILDLAAMAKDSPDDLRIVLVETIQLLNNPFVSVEIKNDNPEH